MSSKLRKRVMRSEARVADLALQLREERAKLARLQRRFSRAVREDSSSDSSSVDSSPARPSETVPAAALADTHPDPPPNDGGDQQGPPPSLPLALADAEQPPAPPPQPTAAAETPRDERKRLILLFADAEGKPTGGGRAGAAGCGCRGSLAGLRTCLSPARGAWPSGAVAGSFLTSCPGWPAD